MPAKVAANQEDSTLQEQVMKLNHSSASPNGSHAHATALLAQVDPRSHYQSMVARLNRQLTSSRQTEEQLTARTLSLLAGELGAIGAGYFEHDSGRWLLKQQPHGILPPFSFVQPEGGSAPLELEEQPQVEEVGAHFHIATPVPVGSDATGLLFLVVSSEIPELTALLDALSFAGHAFGAALHSASLHAIIDQQLTQLRAVEEKSSVAGLSSSAFRNLAWMIDEDEVPHPLIEAPQATIAVGPNRVVMPLTIRGESLGKLLLEDDEQHDWTEDDLALMNVVAEQMAQALDVARLFSESERRAAQLEAAAEVSRAASSLLSLDELMNTSVEQIRRTFGYYHAQVFLVDEENGQWAHLRSSTGDIGRKLLERGHKLGVGSQSIIGQVTSKAIPVVARDTDRDTVHRFNELLPETRAELAVPLKVGNAIIGALDVQSTSPDVFYEDDIAVLQTLADQMAVAIQNARAYERQRESAEQLREMDKLKTQFLANMSHELRTPLNSIIGFSRVILKGIDGPITDLQRKDLNTIYNSGQHLLHLIDGILDISKIEAGKMELEFEDVSLKQVIDVAYSTALGLVKDRPVQLIREIPDDLPTIRADPVRLRQVLLNLLSNSSKFTEQGHIRMTVTHMGDEVMITVADTGLGIPPDKQEHLFEAFYQVDGSGTRKVGGTGLGLAITKSFIEMHGGQIWVESTGISGEGTQFHIVLPVDGPGAQAEEAVEAPLILAVDDEPGITMLYEKYLSPEGYRFAACHDPRKVADEAVRLHPQLILLDARMPEMDGFEVMQTLRRNILTRDIPVIFCAVEAIAQIEQQGSEAGASDFLQKPVLRQDLISAAHRWAGAPLAKSGK